jgi:hypothetical protein
MWSFYIFQFTSFILLAFSLWFTRRINLQLAREHVEKISQRISSDTVAIRTMTNTGRLQPQRDNSSKGVAAASAVVELQEVTIASTATSSTTNSKVNVV